MRVLSLSLLLLFVLAPVPSSPWSSSIAVMQRSPPAFVYCWPRSVPESQRVGIFQQCGHAERQAAPPQFACGHTPCYASLRRRRAGRLAMSGDNGPGQGGSGMQKSRRAGRANKERLPSNDPQEAMKRWAKMVEEGQERVDDLKTKTIRALDNLFAGGFMQEGTDDNDMLPVLRKFLMTDFEGYSPPRAQISPALLDDFENFGQPEALTAPALDDDVAVFEAGGANLTGWGREPSVSVSTGLEDQINLLKPLDRRQFSQAVQSGLEEMEAEDIDLVFDEIDKDGDGALTLEELYETYKTVQAELVTDQEMEEGMGLRDAESAAKLRPETPDAAFSKLAPGGDPWADEGARIEPAKSDISERMRGWQEVCDVLATQSAYLPRAGRIMVEEAVEWSGDLLLLDAADGGIDFGDGISLGGIVAGLQSQAEAVTAAVLLPSLRKGVVGQMEIRERFGPVVASIAEDSLWLSKLPESVGLLDDDGSRYLREYMVAVSRDHRAVIVMLADRLHSLRRTRNAPLYEQHLRALEALQVYSPLAHALGVGKWLWELEDLSFRALFPDSYTDVEQWQLALWEESGDMMEEAKGKVLASLNENSLLTANVERYAISSRRKSLFSTFKKMYQKNKNLEGIKDVFAMRIVIGLIPEQRSDERMQVRACLEAYRSLRQALPEYTEGAGRFKDYASKPKPNGYQSVHTTLNTPSGLPVEIQIRTEEMHAAAEFGDAAHNLYKGGIKSLSSAQKFADSVRKTNVAVLVPDDDNCFSSSSPADTSSTVAAGRDDTGSEATSAEDVEEPSVDDHSRARCDDDAGPCEWTGTGGPGAERRAQQSGRGIAAGDVSGALRPAASGSENLTKRPPSVGAALRLSALRDDDALPLTAAQVLATKDGAREAPFPTIMKAPSIGSEGWTTVVGDAWLGESMGNDIFATVTRPARDAGLGGGEEERRGDFIIDTADEDRGAIALVLEEMEREAWRDVALRMETQPRNAADEAVVRQLLRQQGAGVIKRSERLRMLLDTSLVAPQLPPCLPLLFRPRPSAFMRRWRSIARALTLAARVRQAGLFDTQAVAARAAGKLGLPVVREAARQVDQDLCDEVRDSRVESHELSDVLDSSSVEEEDGGKDQEAVADNCGTLEEDSESESRETNLSCAE